MPIRSSLVILCAGVLAACAATPTDAVRTSILRRLITGRTEVIAHRGGPGPDSTPACARRSLAAGVNFIELDVRLTRDGRAVVIHDPTVDRTTDGTGAVADLTFEQIRRLDAGVRHDRAYAGERIPTPEEMIRTVGERGVILLELKVAAAAGPVVDAVRAERAFDRVVVRSADPAVLRRLKELDPRVQIGTMGPNATNVEELARGGVVALTVVKADRTLVERCHRAGIALWGSNTNDPRAMADFIAAGVDGVITDSTDVLQKLLLR